MKIAGRAKRLHFMINSGLLQVPQSKSEMRRELEVLTAGHPVRRIKAGVSGLPEPSWKLSKAG